MVFAQKCSISGVIIPSGNSNDYIRIKYAVPEKGEDMDNSVIIALISLAGTLVGSLGGILVSGKLTAYRIQQLECRVAEHNNFARRMPVIEEQIKVINHRLNDLEGG